jgi:hypothetical protein
MFAGGALGVMPVTFREDLVFFVEDVSTTRGLIGNVFIHTLVRDRTVLETAATASLQIDLRSGDRIFQEG